MQRVVGAVRLSARALAALLFILPVVAAASAATLDLTVQGEAVARDGVRVEGRLLAAYTNDSEHLRSLDVTAERMVVHVYRKEYLSTPRANVLPQVRLQTNTTTDRIMLENATITLEPDGQHFGWLGIYGSGDALLDATTRAPARLVPRSGGTIGNQAVGALDDPPDRYAFGPLLDAHVLARMPGEYEMRGTGALKIMGPDVVISANGTARAYDTGTQRAARLPDRTEVEEWLYVEIMGARVAFDSARAVDAAYESVHLSWDGPLALGVLSGSIQQDGEMRTIVQQRATVDGTMTGTLAPSGDDTGRLFASGDIRASSIRTAATHIAGASVVPGVALGAAVLVAIASVSVVIVARRIKRRRRAGDDILQALRARFPAAGEAEFEAARLFAAAGDYMVGTKWLLLALEDAPERVLDITGDDVLAPVAKRDEARAAIDRALQRAGLRA